MNNKHNDKSNLSIVEAVGTLSSIVDMDEDKIEGIEEQKLSTEKLLSNRRVNWLHPENLNKTVRVVEGTFHVVLTYLRNFYRQEYFHSMNDQTIEGIKTLMVLVGETAKKVDKYTEIFHQTNTQRVKDLKVYKDLQEFYLSRIAHKIDDGVLSKWIFALSQQAFLGKTTPQEPKTILIGKKIETKHIFIDLEAVKDDSEYELFYLHKEDGSRFFSSRLIRNIKLVCDFGDSLTKNKEDDPLVDMLIWRDHVIQGVAKMLMRSVGTTVDHFYLETKKYKEHELVKALNNALMALMLSSYSSNLLKNDPFKSCLEYFIDFQRFLREALNTRQYQKLIAYPPTNSDPLGLCLLETIHTICFSLFALLQGYYEVGPLIHKLLIEANQEKSREHLIAAKTCHLLWSHLGADYAAMAKLLKRHPNGPFIKTLNAIESGKYHFFDPIWQQNLPSQRYALYVNEKKIINLHLPSPTYQEMINKATVTEEFKGFLRGLGASHSIKEALIFNLQDRTSWREHSRAVALEELSLSKEFSKSLTVVTIPKNTEFYHQIAPYHDDNQAEIFFQHLKEHLEDENCGFYIPQRLKKMLFPQFVERTIRSIHRIFFEGKNVLPKEDRLNFIEVFYIFLQLKLIELVNPEVFSFTCKDGVDIGNAASVELFAFLKVLNQEEATVNDKELINTLLYSTPLFERERIMNPECFHRMLNAIKTIEASKEEFGYINFAKIIYEAFGLLFKTPILHAKIIN